MPRLFTGIPLSAELRQRLAKTAKELAQFSANTAWVGAEKMHITMRFLGEVSEMLIPQIEEAIRQTAQAHPPFPLEVCGLGAFPNPKRVRVLWAGLTIGKPEALALFNTLEKELAKAGFAKETRPFSAHITLGRVRFPKHNVELERKLAESAEIAFGKETAERLVLFKSTLQPRGSIYEELFSAELSSDAQHS
jgi:2'-5' RNA ligase